MEKPSFSKTLNLNKIKNNKKYNFSEEEIKSLIFSVWEVAYNEGVSEGESSCAAYYHGHSNSKPIKAKEAWIDRVEWRIISESEKFDITNLKNWNDINY